MTVNKRMAKSHGYYLQHAKEVCLVGRRGAVPPTARQVNPFQAWVSVSAFGYAGRVLSFIQSWSLPHCSSTLALLSTNDHQNAFHLAGYQRSMFIFSGPYYE